MDPRTRALIEAPIAPTLLRLAIPNVITTVAQASTGLIETYFIGKLGTDALAGVALVFPGVMLMQMMSAGAMGGGVSSAIARALGSGRREDADATILHALIIAAGFAAFFSIAMLAGGLWLYAALGGRGGSLAAALTYSNIVFAGVILIWLFNTLANVIRGTGNTFVPAVVTIAGAALLVPLSAALIFGFGPLPKMGVAGGATALLTYYGFGSLAFAYYLWSGLLVVASASGTAALAAVPRNPADRRGGVADLADDQRDDRPDHRRGRRLRPSRDCRLRRWHPAGISADPAGLWLRRPAGSGRYQHRRWQPRPCRAGGLDRRRWICAALCETIGVAAALFPTAWLSLFDSDPAMIAAGTPYLRIVGPFYGFFGLGMALYFIAEAPSAPGVAAAGQSVRLVIAVVGGYLLLRWTGSLMFVCTALAAGLAVLGLTVAGAVWGGAWFNSRK